MAYQGDEMIFSTVFNFSISFAIVVSGAKWNPCGHMLLNTGGKGGWYFHVAEVRVFPKYMNEVGYKRYLKENNKTEIRRNFVSLEDPQGANAKLSELLSKKWTWFLLPNNCANFVEEVLQAGGTKAGLYTNCPAFENFK